MDLKTDFPSDLNRPRNCAAAITSKKTGGSPPENGIGREKSWTAYLGMSSIAIARKIAINNGVPSSLQRLARPEKKLEYPDFQRMIDRIQAHS